MLPRGIGFHDALITAIEHSRDGLVLEVEGVQVPGAPGQFDLARGTLTFARVHGLVIDGVDADTVTMEGDDGEILRLDWVEGGSAELFVIWSRSRDRQQRNRFYRISCADLNWTQTTPA